MTQGASGAASLWPVAASLRSLREAGRRGGGVRVCSQATVRRAAGARVMGSTLFDDAENVALWGYDRVDFSG